MTKER